MSDTNPAGCAATVEIRHAAWHAGIVPSLGGAMLFLRHNGADILRPAVTTSPDPLGSASFALVPYANRIADGRLVWNRSDHSLPLNFGDHPHSLHGIGWQSRWRVASANSDSVILALDYRSTPAWPWAFEAEQRLAVTERGFDATLTLTNKDDRTMPAGLGFHPYFPRPATARLGFDAGAVWLADEMQIPTQRADHDHFGDWSTPRSPAADGLIDHYYDGWDGVARLSDDRGQTVLTGVGARGLHVYLPPGADFLCLEPVSHAPNAFNRRDMEFDTIGPGGSIELRMRIERH